MSMCQVCQLVLGLYEQEDFVFLDVFCLDEQTRSGTKSMWDGEMSSHWRLSDKHWYVFMHTSNKELIY